MKISDLIQNTDDAVNEAWSNKYKRSIDCDNPQGFSQRAHCAARRKRSRGEKTQSKSVSESIKNRHQLVIDAVNSTGLPYSEIWFHGSRAIGKHKPSSDWDYLIVVPPDEDYIKYARVFPKLKPFKNVDIQPIRKDDNIYKVAKQEGIRVDTQQVSENFKDGKGPGRPGDSRRHGIPKNATLAQLDKIGKGSGRKAQLARWQANMRRGRAKVTEAIAPHGTPENELAMMKAGTKPAVLMLSYHYDELYKPIVEKMGWEVVKFHMDGYDHYVVAQQGDRQRAEKIAKLVSDGNKIFKLGKAADPEYHRQLGTLLGYPKADIEDFINQNKKTVQNLKENNKIDQVIFLNKDTVIVGQEHGHPVNLSTNVLKKVQEIAAKHGAWYEGNGRDREFTRDIIKKWKGSWDDIVAKNIKGYPPEFLYVLFANVDANNRVDMIGENSKQSIFDQILKNQKQNTYFTDRTYNAGTLKKFLQMVSQNGYDFVKMSEQPATRENITKFLKTGESLMWPSNWADYPNPAGKVALRATTPRDKFLANAPPGAYFTGSGHLVDVGKLLKKELNETREGAWKWLKSKLPDWPDYVLRDWIYNLVKGDFEKGQDPTFELWKMFQAENMSADTQWVYVPNQKFTMDMWNDWTVDRLTKRAGGKSHPDIGVTRDQERHAMQKQIMTQQGGVRTEPVIMKETKNGYELIEGWHRTIQHFAAHPTGYTAPAWIAKL